MGGGGLATALHCFGAKEPGPRQPGSKDLSSFDGGDNVSPSALSSRIDSVRAARLARRVTSSY